MTHIYNYMLRSKDVDEYGQHDYKTLSCFDKLELGAVIEWGADKRGNLRKWEVYEVMN